MNIVFITFNCLKLFNLDKECLHHFPLVRRRCIHSERVLFGHCEEKVIGQSIGYMSKMFSVESCFRTWFGYIWLLVNQFSPPPINNFSSNRHDSRRWPKGNKFASLHYSATFCSRYSAETRAWVKWLFLLQLLVIFRLK